MAHCTVLKEWKLVEASYDGEPRRAVEPLLGCRTCNDFMDCVAKVRVAWTLDQMTEALKG